MAWLAASRGLATRTQPGQPPDAARVGNHHRSPHFLARIVDRTGYASDVRADLAPESVCAQIGVHAVRPT